MEKYRLNLYISGVDNELDESCIGDVKILRKGDVSNKRTGKKFSETIVTKTIYVDYESGFNYAIDKMINFIINNQKITEIINKSKNVTFQVCVDLDEECNVPYINFTPKQLNYLVGINAEIEFHIS